MRILNCITDKNDFGDEIKSKNGTVFKKRYDLLRFTDGSDLVYYDYKIKRTSEHPRPGEVIELYKKSDGIKAKHVHETLEVVEAYPKVKAKIKRNLDETIADVRLVNVKTLGLIVAISD